MDVAWGRIFCALAVLTTAVGTCPAADPPAKPPAAKPAAEYADPQATYRTYLEAIRKNDLTAAKRCWVIDDDNKSGALDTVVGLWISARRVNQLAEKKFGTDGLDEALKGLRRDDVSDAALDLTAKRLADAEVVTTGDTAELTLKWKKGDGGDRPAFGYRATTHFRKVDGEWKIDFHQETGLTRGEDFFAEGDWGVMFRDAVAVMNEATDGMEKGKLTSVKELGAFVAGRTEELVKKYEEKRKKESRKDKR
jgi:hypothetical protein